MLFVDDLSDHSTRWNSVTSSVDVWCPFQVILQTAHFTRCFSTFLLFLFFVGFQRNGRRKIKKTKLNEKLAKNIHKHFANNPHHETLARSSWELWRGREENGPVESRPDFTPNDFDRICRSFRWWSAPHFGPIIIHSQSLGMEWTSVESKKSRWKQNERIELSNAFIRWQSEWWQCSTRSSRNEANGKEWTNFGLVHAISPTMAAWCGPCNRSALSRAIDQAVDDSWIAV